MKSSEIKLALTAFSFFAFVLLQAVCLGQDKPIADASSSKAKSNAILLHLDTAKRLFETGKADEAISMIRGSDIESIVRQQLKIGDSFYLAVDSGPSPSANFPGLSKELAREVTWQKNSMGGVKSSRNYETVGFGCMTPAGNEGEFEVAKVKFAHRINLVMFHLSDEGNDALNHWAVDLDVCRQKVDMTEQQWSSISLISKLKIREFIYMK